MTSWTFLFIYLFIYLFIFLYFLYYYFWLLFLWLGYEIFAGSLALVSVVLRSILMPLLGFQAQHCLFWIVHFFYASFSVPVPFLSLSRNSFMDEAPCLSHAISLVMSCMVMYTMMNTEGVHASYVACGCLAYCCSCGISDCIL